MKGRHVIVGVIVVFATMLIIMGIARAAPGIAGMAHIRAGIASWYGPRFQGKRMANGCKFDSDAETAPSPNLPLGTVISVTRIDTGDQVIVPITDRGPYIRGRILDLSRAPAEPLASIATGTLPRSASPIRRAP